MEIVCDAMTMQKTHTSLKHYGQILIEAFELSKKSKPNPMFAYMSKTNLSRRIYAMKAKTSHRPVLSIIFSAALLVGGAAAVAATSGIIKSTGRFFVKTYVMFNGKPVSAPEFVVIGNEPASLEMKSDDPPSNLKIMLTASDFSNDRIEDGIDLKLAIDYQTQEKTFRVNPHVVVNPGEDATITVGSNSTDTMEMIIHAERR
jgi:hypothetical protein